MYEIYREVKSMQRGIPFRIADPKKPILLIDNVFVNQQGPFCFAVDTAATVTVLSPELAQRLGYTQEEDKQNEAAGVGAGGQLQGVSLVTLESLRVGDNEVADLQAAIVDLKDVQQMIDELEGLLGYNFLSKFRITLDYQEQLILFEPYS